MRTITNLAPIAAKSRLAGFVVVVGLSLVTFSGCGGGGNSDGIRDPGSVRDGDPAALSDVDAAPNEVLESAVPGTPVRLTLSLASTGGNGVTFSLRDNASGAFAIDPVSGVVTLAGGVDFEASPIRTLVAEASVGQDPNRTVYVRAFQIAILDSPAPSLELTFPFSHARFGDGAISVSGLVSHPQPDSVRVSASAGGAVVQGVIVGGIFQVRDISVSGNGTFTLRVLATHPGGDVTEQNVTLSREPELTDVPRMVLDAARVLMVDRYTPAIIASPLDGGPRSIVSGRHVGSGPALVNPVALSMDPDAQILYVVDGELKSLFRVELASGNRTLLGGGGPAIYAPTELDFDPVRRQLLLSDESVGLLVIDPVTGERRLLSSSQSVGPAIYYFRGLTFDPVGDRILVSDSSSLFAVNPVSGARTMISDWNNDAVTRFFRGMTVAHQSNAAYVADEFTNGVVRIDLASGARETVTSSGLALFNYLPVGAGPVLQYPEDVVVSADNRLFLIEGEYADPLVEVRPNGDRSVVRDASLGTGVNFRGPAGIKYDAARRMLLVADNVADFVTEIDPATGNRTLIAGRSDGRGSIDFEWMDAAPGTGGQYYYVDFITNGLYAVRAGEAAQVVSDAATGSGPLLDNPTGLEIDQQQGVAYVIDGGMVLSIDLTTGIRRSLASGFISLTGLAADFANQRLYVAEGSGSVFNIDVSTGARRLVSSGNGSNWSGDLAFDSTTRSLIVVRQNPARVDRINETGAGSSPALDQALNCGPTLKMPRGIAVDSSRQVAYITDDFYDGIIAIDLRTGCRQLVAK